MPQLRFDHVTAARRSREQGRDRHDHFDERRLTNVHHADRVSGLHHGRLVEAGTHDQVMDAGGRRAELLTRQAASYDTTGPAATVPRRTAPT